MKSSYKTVCSHTVRGWLPKTVGFQMQLYRTLCAVLDILCECIIPHKIVCSSSSIKSYQNIHIIGGLDKVNLSTIHFQEVMIAWFWSEGIMLSLKTWRLCGQVNITVLKWLWYQLSTTRHLQWKVEVCLISIQNGKRFSKRDSSMQSFIGLRLKIFARNYLDLLDKILKLFALISN